MTRSERIAKVEGLFRPLITAGLSPQTVVRQYSKGRIAFLDQLYRETPQPYAPPEEFGQTLWDVSFRFPLLNAAGLFKNGEGYDLVYAQGAGGYLGGTGTWDKREGNAHEGTGIKTPFAPYPRSHAASNFLGLPNDGDQVNAKRAAEIDKKYGCPVGWSVMASPSIDGEERFEKLVEGMKLYRDAGVDFLELNVSCPNTEDGQTDFDAITDQLQYVKNGFMGNENHTLPVIVKFSTDTEVAEVPRYLNILFELGYDGVNFGNTSTNYDKHRTRIDRKEQALFDYFTKGDEFGVGGGLSGNLLKTDSLWLAEAAVRHVETIRPDQEFHVIRTGGIETAHDLHTSRLMKIPLQQWFTGYFHEFAKHGHDLYKHISKELVRLRTL